MKDVAAVAQAVRDVYAENGFPERHRRLESRGEDEGGTEAGVRGRRREKIKIAAIRFTGNRVFSASRIRLAMKKSKVNVLWRVFSDKTVYNQANFDEDVESIKHLYQDYGYKDVVVKDPVLDIYVSNPKQKKAKKIRNGCGSRFDRGGEKFYFGRSTSRSRR